MKTLFLLCLQLWCVQCLHAQKFEFQFSHGLPDTVTFHGVEWADLDNDGLLDVIAFAENSDDESVCFLLKNDGPQGLTLLGHFNTRLADARWLITDIDGDNLVDVMMSGTSDEGALTSQFLNTGNFAVEETSLFSANASVMRMADFNQDGAREILISGYRDNKPYLKIFENRGGEWTAVYDSIMVCASTVETFDFDADTDLDFFINGVNEFGKKVSRAFYNERGLYFSSKDFIPGVSGGSVKADLNHDGNFDVLLAGEDDDNQPRLLALMNDGVGNFLLSDTLHAASNAVVFSGDLSADGLSDVNITGLEGDGDTVNLIASLPEVYLSHKHLVSQSWGDGDRDGDLDLLQLTKTSEGHTIQLFQNTTLPTNAAPISPSGLVIAEVMNRLFVCWEKSTDDRTPPNSLTYDVAIHVAGRGVMSADFDVLNGRRLNVSHGNNGTADYVLLRDVGTADAVVNIQAVDNAFHAGPGSICKGSGGGGRGLCSEVEIVNLALCKNEKVTLSGPSDTRWFSFERGFLADTSALVYDFHRPDTVFSLARKADCAYIAVYVLEYGTNVKRVTESSEQVCQGEIVQFGVEPDWQAVEWSSVSEGFLSNEDTIAYVATKADTLKVRVSDDSGCVIERYTAINISKPVIIGDDAYQILKGETVRLSVSGATSYEWSPQTGLDDATSSDPLASPLQTTEYTVTASDSSGCRSFMRVLVLVEQTAFVPNLFTPNHDGRNDVLKIYGLGPVTDFSFAIYNREGITVYHSQDVSKVVTEGWNGTTGGVDQPGGVYYWNVSGQTAGGKELKLNGRNSGSIVLLR